MTKANGVPVFRSTALPTVPVLYTCKSRRKMPVFFIGLMAFNLEFFPRPSLPGTYSALIGAIPGVPMLKAKGVAAMGAKAGFSVNGFRLRLHTVTVFNGHRLWTFTVLDVHRMKPDRAAVMHSKGVFPRFIEIGDNSRFQVRKGLGGCSRAKVGPQNVLCLEVHLCGGFGVGRLEVRRGLEVCQGFAFQLSGLVAVAPGGRL